MVGDYGTILDSHDGELWINKASDYQRSDIYASFIFGNLLIAGRKMTGVTDKQLKELGIMFTPQQ